jgi:predicted class III extradiol MEMO1 family dioxygenase
MDGTRDVGTLRAGFELRTGRTVSNATVEQILSQLDEALFLENDQFFEAYQNALDSYRTSPTRHPILAGSCYPDDPAALRSFMQEHLDQASCDSFEEPEGVVGLISPHIDYQRGAHVYAQVWSKAKTALEKAELIIILGTDHNDKYLLGDKTCPIVPILCGSFQIFIENGESPLKARQIASTINVLKKVYQSQRTIVVVAADLAHMGLVFGDSMPLDIVGQARMAKNDEELIQILCRGDADDFYSMIQREKDRRHVCGVPPIYIGLSSMPATQGTPAGYAQCPASPDRTSLVSICGVLYRTNESSTSIRC